MSGIQKLQFSLTKKIIMAHVSYVFLFRFFVSGNCNFWFSDMFPAKPIQGLGSICFFVFLCFINIRRYGSYRVTVQNFTVPNFQWLRPGSQWNLPGYQSRQRETAERSPPCSGGLKGLTWKNPWNTPRGHFLGNGGWLGNMIAKICTSIGFNMLQNLKYYFYI